MKLIIDGNEYTCRARVRKEQRVDFIGVAPAVENADLTGKIETYDDADNLIALDLVGAYQNAYVVGAIITLTSEPSLADAKAVEEMKLKAPKYDEMLSHMPEVEAAVADNDAMNVDQELRITMLELGIADDGSV